VTPRDRATPAAPRGSSWDWTTWRPDRGRLAAAGCVLAFAVALWAQGGSAQRAMGCLTVVETALLGLPWRLPRDARSARSFRAESLAGLLAPVGAVVVALACGAPWLRHGAAWWWYPLAAAAGVGVLLAGGMDVRALLGGELAFVLGPTPRSHARTRATCTAVGPFGEEVLFRGTVLAAASPATASFGLLAAVAFVARHHVQPGSNRRGSSRALLTEIAAAAVLLALTVASGSILPALLAHLINNIPAVVLELQRERPEGPEGEWA
jgi:Type II CAAX prenyl endopeptidase Rce1-like